MKSAMIWTPGSDPYGGTFFDATDSTKFLAVGGGAISDGATIGTWNSSTGSLALAQLGSVARGVYKAAAPTNGKGGALFAAASQQAIGSTSISGYSSSITGITALAIVSPVTEPTGINAYLAMLLVGGSSQLELGIDGATGKVLGGGRRVSADSFQQLLGTTSNGTGSTFVAGVVLDFANALITVYRNGVIENGPSAFQAAGSPSGVACVSVGASANASGGAFWADGYQEGCYFCPQALTVTQIQGPTNFLRMQRNI
jgi:hypothetical protein